MNLIHPSVRNSLWDSYFWRNMYWAIPRKEKEEETGTGLGWSFRQRPADHSTCRRNETVIGQLWDRLWSQFPQYLCSERPACFCWFWLFRDITWGKLPFFNSIAFVKVFSFFPSYERVLEAPYLKRTSNYPIKTYLTPDCPLSRSCIQRSKFSGLLADLITGVKNFIANKQQGGMESVEGT